jgi:hypothetical protein
MFEWLMRDIEGKTTPDVYYQRKSKSGYVYSSQVIGNRQRTLLEDKVRKLTKDQALDIIMRYLHCKQAKISRVECVQKR